jgi:hypothetical protein
MKSGLSYAGLFAALIVLPAFAQNTTPPQITPGTNAADQEQIEQGLQNGSLSSGEASKMERDQQALDRAESHGASQQRLDQIQNNDESQLNKLENNKVTGNPNGANDKLMQSDVQRNINQQNRIEKGVQSGQVTPGEEKNLERGQKRINRDEANSKGHLENHPGRQASIQRRENNQSKNIYDKKHNDRRDNGTPPPSGGTTP